MASRISSKKSLKSVSKTSAKSIDVPSYDPDIRSSDLLLVNRGGTDANTEASDLAEFVGKQLGIDSLVDDINKEINAIGDKVTNELTVEIEANSGAIDQLETDLEALEGRVDGHDGDIAGHATDIGTNTTNISANAAAIAANVTAIAASDAENVRQNSWTGIAGGTNSDTNATHKARIDALEAKTASLSGALVFKGVGDFTSTAPAAESGHFYLCNASGTASGWTGLSDVKENSYYAYDGISWAEAGNNAVIIPEAGDGNLSLTSANKAIAINTGTGFSANTTSDFAYEVELDLNDEGGLQITDDGIGINGGDGLLVGAGGIAVDPTFITSTADVGEADLTIAAADASVVVTGGAFSANAKADVAATVAVNTDGKGIGVGSDGIEINVKPGQGIIVDDDGISVDAGFISGVAGPVPNLDAVLGQGGTSTKAASVGAFTATSVTSTGAVTAAGSNAANTSSFLFKDISQLPSLADV